MIIAPIPSDRVKKEWPRASSAERAWKPPVVGRNMNPSASPAPSMLRALTSSSTRMPKSAGISTRATRSMPPLIPL